ncbi:MAG: DUF4261 domain-containing protein [Myxococcales bacterium]
MGILERFFGKTDRDDAPSATLVANESLKTKRSLQLLFEGGLQLDAAAVTRTLRRYDPTMARAAFEVDGKTAASGTPLGLLGWGKHVIRFVGFGAKMPSEVVERCVQPAHYGADLKARARGHKSHLILFYAGYEETPREQYVALAAVAGVLAKHGAIVVLNESGHTSFPTDALAAGKGDMMELLRTLPIPILYSGFVKYDVGGTQGVWMRTYGNHLLDLPDFAHLAQGHHEGQATFDLICNLLSYLQTSGAKFAPGHTMEVGPNTFLKVRSPQESEYFLDSEGEIFVLEKITKDQTRGAS